MFSAAAVELGGDAGELGVASAVTSSSTPSVASSAWCCLSRACSGSVRMRQQVRLGERLELDPDREAALQLRDQVRGLGDVEGAGGDEEHVVGAHRRRSGW